MAPVDQRERPGALGRHRGRVRLRRVGRGPAALREGLPRPGPRGRCPVRRRGLRQHLFRAASLPVPSRDRVLRHTAHRHAQQRDDPLRGRRRGRFARLRQHALRADGGVLRRPAVGAHHRLAGGAGAVLRPGQADARRGHQPDPHAGGRGAAAGRGGDGGRQHLPLRARGGALRRGSGRARPGPLLRRRRAGAPRLHGMRRVHDGLPAQRQEHPGQELPAPGRVAGGRDSSAEHGDPDPAGRRPARRWSRRGAKPLRKLGGG